MVMNSFSTVFKRRAITLSIAILCAIIGAIGMRAYSVLQRQRRCALREARADYDCRLKASKTQEKSALFAV